VRAVVLVSDVAGRQKAISALDAATAPVLTRAAGVAASRVLLDQQRVILLHVLHRHGEKLRPPGMAVEAVLAGNSGDAAVQDLHRLERLAVRLDTGVDEVRARAVGAGDIEADGLGVDRPEHVEQPRHDHQSVAQGRGILRAQDRAFGDVHLDDVFVAVVE
jgi:hypothetical protein